MLHAIRNTLHADLRLGTERGKLIRSAGITAGLKVGATLLAFGASLLYARVLGPHDYGLYAYVIACVSVLTVPAGLGLPQYLIREGANAPEHLRWLCGWSDARVLAGGLAAAALIVVAAFLPAAAEVKWLCFLAAPLPLLNNLGSVRQALLQGLGQVIRSQWPTLLLAPAGMLTALVILWACRGTLNPINLIATMAAATFLPLIINSLQLRRASPSPSAVRYVSASLRGSLPFMCLGMLYLINSRTDLIMLGALRGADEVGIYAVVVRAAEFIAFFLAASNVVIAPRMARLYKEGDHFLLQRLLTGASRRVFAVSAPVAFLFLVAAAPLLVSLYGADYQGGALALQILAGAHLVNVAAGPTDTLLEMTNHEGLSAFCAGLTVLLNILLNATLIPHFSIAGAAIATGTSLVAWNVMLCYCSRRRLRLRPTVIGF